METPFTDGVSPEDAAANGATPPDPLPTGDGRTDSAHAADILSDLVGTVVEFDRMIAQLQGMRAEAIEQARVWVELTSTPGRTNGVGVGSMSWGLRSLIAELACALRLPEQTVQGMIATSTVLLNDLPATHAALRAGEITYRNAQVLADQCAGPSPEAVTALEDAVLGFAASLTPGKFERKTRTIRELADPESITTRTEAAVEKRMIELVPAKDGMAYLTAFLPAPAACAMYDRVTDTAISMLGPEEARTLTQLRADVFTGVMLAPENGLAAAVSTGSESTDTGTLDDAAFDPAEADAIWSRFCGIRPMVCVTVPVMTLLGLSEAPASLDGYGPIDPDTARVLAAHAPNFVRILTHPETGATLSVGKKRYKPPPELALWLRLRDGTCRFPGCGRKARQCDIDHTTAWQHSGQTNHNNLAHLCPKHHALKHHTPEHHTDWNVSQPADGSGVLTWVSPAGRSYVTQPETKVETPETEIAAGNTDVHQ